MNEFSVSIPDIWRRWTERFSYGYAVYFPLIDRIEEIDTLFELMFWQDMGVEVVYLGRIYDE